MKEKEESPEKELIEIKASNLSNIEFKVMVIRMFKELSKNYINMKKDIETSYNNLLEMKNAVSEMKNTLRGIKSRLDETGSNQRFGSNLTKHFKGHKKCHYIVQKRI